MIMLGGILRRGPDPLITEAAGDTLAPWRQYLSESNDLAAAVLPGLRGGYEWSPRRTLKICVTRVDDVFLAHVPPQKLAHLMETFTFSRDERTFG